MPRKAFVKTPHTDLARGRTVTVSKVCLLLLLAGCEGAAPGVDTIILPGSTQLNLTISTGPSCPPPTITMTPSRPLKAKTPAG
jgi:hypothetical protein